MNNQNHTGQAPVDQHIYDLINGSIDGEITADEQDELDRLLAESSSARKLDLELRSITRILDDLPEVEPPGYLQSAIQRQVRLPAQRAVSASRDGFKGGWLNANWLRTGFALAAGVILTVGIYEMGSGPVTDRDAANMSGTMVKNGPNEQSESLLDRLQLNTGQLNGLVELHAQDDLFTLDVRLMSDVPSEVIVNFAASGMEIDGVSRMQYPVDTVAIADGAIHLSSTGEQHYVVKLRRTSPQQPVAPLKLDFIAGNELVQQSELNVSGF